MRFFDSVEQAVRAHSSQPAVTWLDGPSRIELSFVSLGNAISKAANLLTGEWDLTSLESVTLELPLHWQRPVWACAVLSCGSAIDQDNGEFLITSVDVDEENDAVGVVSVHPFGVATQDRLNGINFSNLVGGMPDMYFQADARADDELVLNFAGEVLKSGELVAYVRDRASDLGITDRAACAVLSSSVSPDAFVFSTIAPIILGSQCVLIEESSDTDRLLSQENISVVIN